jgi:hypothetical protein
MGWEGRTKKTTIGRIEEGNHPRPKGDFVLAVGEVKSLQSGAQD